MSEPRVITEEKDQELLEDWKKRAREVKTVDEFLAFMRELDTAYVHDYGTCVHAAVAAMMSAFWLANSSHMTRGGLTGFQASCAGLMVVKDLCSIEGPFRIVRFANLLYPQYEHSFEKRITPDSWQWMQNEARKLLAEHDRQASENPEIAAFVSRDVLEHWRAIDRGIVPFGFVVSKDE
jgi:hypothetical protein